MRLWHKDLIEVLPNQQLVSQWRECCAIARNIKVNGTPNHLLVNKVLEFPLKHFYGYSFMIAIEMRNRGFKCDLKRFTQWIDDNDIELEVVDLFPSWHNKRYLLQCFTNLQEKYDCGGISDEEYNRIEERYLNLL